MTSIQKMRRNFTILLGVMGALSFGFLAYLYWPGSSTAASRRAEEKALQLELVSKKKQAGPLQGIQEKLTQSQLDVKKLTQDHVPSRFSEIIDTLYKVVQENGVSAQHIQYDTDKSGLPGMQLIKINTTVSGDYTRVAQFINALEREKLLFVIKQVSLSQQQQSGTVDLQIRFETYIKDKS
ncbi:MAG: type 4a pilus biogenesis protein PilO [Acidobacteriia bacterium]|nr:type 4a pilus biogenesis protein PilO [Terriglobia bacterium]